MTVHLLKHGGLSFAFDMKNNMRLLKELQNIDVKHFEGKFNKKAKQLDYKLVVIKHRAQYIEKLVTDERMLEEEREKAAEKRLRTNQSFSADEIAQTSVGLKFNNNNGDLGASPKQVTSETTYHCLTLPKSNPFKTEA